MKLSLLCSVQCSLLTCENSRPTSFLASWQNVPEARSEERLACVAGVKRIRGNLGARELVGLLPRAWSRVLIPFPFPFARLPRRLRRDGLFSQANSLPARELSPRKLDWLQIKIRRVLIPAGALVKNHAAYLKRHRPSFTCFTPAFPKQECLLFTWRLAQMLRSFIWTPSTIYSSKLTCAWLMTICGK